MTRNKMKKINLLLALLTFFSVTQPVVAKPKEKSKTSLLATPTPSVPGAPKPAKSEKKSDVLGLGGGNMGKLPTYITSKTLEVESDKRVFYYRTDVSVKQGDMTLTCDELEGQYNENNQIERMIAKKNVIIVKGDKLRATSEHAVYDATTAIITMTENPKLQQNNSLLLADVVKIFINEDRSVAEGDVSVTMVNEKTPTVVPIAGTPAAGAGAPSSNVAPTPTPMSMPTPTNTPIPGVQLFGN